MSRPRKNPRHITGTVTRTTLEEKILRKLDKIDAEVSEMKEFKEAMTCKLEQFEDHLDKMARQLKGLANKVEETTKFGVKLENFEKQTTKRINDDISDTKVKLGNVEEFIQREICNKLQKLDLKISTTDWSLRADIERMEDSLTGVPMLRSSLENLRKFVDNKLQTVNSELNKLRADMRAEQKKSQLNEVSGTIMVRGQSAGWTSKIGGSAGNNTITDHAVCDRDLAHICSVIASEYYRVGLELGLSTEMLCRCSAKSRDDNYRKTIEMLKMWKMKESKNASWGRLRTALIKLDLTDMVTALNDRFPNI